MAKQKRFEPDADNKQFLFDFSFGDIQGRVETAVKGGIDTLIKTIPASDSDEEGAVEKAGGESAAFDEEPEALSRGYGAWLSFDRRMSVKSRAEFNRESLEIIKKPPSEITGADRATLRHYSGFGGLGTEGEQGVLYDYYTSPPVALMTWKLLNKIKPLRKGDRVLEPSCGTGVFFETAPEGLRLHGVELDPRTAAVARALHPSAAIKNMSFESFNLSQNKKGFDCVIGNAPFGERSPGTRFLDLPREKSLDRYFISRGLDALKPGGVMALIVHPGIIGNETNEAFRAAVSRKAYFTGAVRLNDHSFAHTHTQVQPDILFFQKHPEGMEQRLAQVPDGELAALLNTLFIHSASGYFANFPLHVMGEVSGGSGQWGNDVVKGFVTPETIDKTINSFIPLAGEEQAGEIYRAVQERYPLRDEREKAAAENLPLTDEEARLAHAKELRPGFLKAEQNSSNVYILADSNYWSLASSSTDLSARVRMLLAVSANVAQIRGAMTQDRGAGPLQEQTAALLRDYFENFNVYPAGDPFIKSFTRKFPAVSGIYDGMIEPSSPVLTEENLYRNGSPAVSGHSRAVQALYTLRENFQPATEEAITKWFPREAESLIGEMNGHGDIFLTPEKEYQLREDFISGNAWDKIEALEKAKTGYEGDRDAVSRFSRYQDELRKAVNWTPFEESALTPHAPWIPEEIINDFARSGYCPRRWAFEYKTLGKDESGKWGLVTGGQWEPFNDPLVYYLNRQKQRSRNTDTEIFNREYNEQFINFAASHPEHRQTLEKGFNRLYNAEIKAPVKTYPVFIEGWTGVKTLKAHQWQSVHHLYREQAGISALGTGYGKTLAGIALYSLLRQEHKARRVFFQVPNNKVKDWVREFADVMPSLKIGYIDPETPGYSSRNKRYAAYQALANSSYDVLIFPESAASEIQLRPENDGDIVQNVVSLHMAEKSAATARQKEMLEMHVASSMENGRTNRTVYFEDFGCDALFVDEAHRYKNLFTSSLSREIGLNDGRQSAKAMALFKKAALIRKQNGGKNIFLFTATPLTNSPLEYYNMLMYIAPSELLRFRITTIDKFIHNFTEITQAETYDWRTGQAALKKILTGFTNIRTLQDIFFKYTDYQNDPKAVNLDKPDPVLIPNIIPKDKIQAAAVKAVSARLEAFSRCTAEEREEKFPRQNYLTFYTRLRTASLDLELSDPVKHSGWVNPKLSRMAENAARLCRETGAGQVIFCDRVFSADKSFNMHEKIKSYLVREGFEENKIAVINGFTKSGGEMSDGETEKLVSKTTADYNAGKYKVLIGTTGCIGEGLNLQKNSCAVHHFDIPFRPSDFIQRGGRVDRQGNSQDKVHIHTYMASGTIDTYSVSLVQNKANWIDELLKSKTNVFVNKDDESSINPAELLLALSEEFGDKNKTEELKERLKHEEETKLAAGREKKRIRLIQTLERYRVPLYRFRGDKNSFDYLQRTEKVKNIEKTLLAIPSFANKEIIGDNKPFLYSEKYDKIISMGDYVFYNRSKHAVVTGFDFKSKSVLLKPLKGNDAWESRLEYLELDGGLFAHNPGKEFLSVIPLASSGSFYREIKDDGIKEKYYPYHLQSYACLHPVPLFHITDGNLYAGYTNTIYEPGKYLNPFSGEDLEKMKTAKTLTFLDIPRSIGVKEAYKKALAGIKEYTPAAFSVVSGLLPIAPPVYREIIPDYHNTPGEFEDNLKFLSCHPYYKGDPVRAAKAILDNTDEKDRKEIKKALRKMGCTDGARTLKVISALSPPGKNNEKITDIKDFFRGHVRVSGLEI